MKQSLSENNILIIAFALPVLLIIIVGVSTVIPALLLQTNYNFVYAVCESSEGNYWDRSNVCRGYVDQYLSVEDGRLLVNEVADETVVQEIDDVATSDEYQVTRTRTEDSYEPEVKLFLHNTKTNESREISLAEAQLLELDPLVTSPDGVAVSWEYDRGVDLFLVFDSGSSRGYYLKKGNRKKELELIRPESSYYQRDDFEFIGWVLPGRGN